MEQYATIGQLQHRLEEIERTLLRARLGGGVAEEKLTEQRKAALRLEADDIRGVIISHLSQKHGVPASEIFGEQEEYLNLLKIEEIFRWSAEVDLGDPSITEKLKRIFGGTLSQEDSRQEFRNLLDQLVELRRKAGMRRRRFWGISLPW